MCDICNNDEVFAIWERYGKKLKKVCLECYKIYSKKEDDAYDNIRIREQHKDSLLDLLLKGS
jgi:hypothetical protein